MPRSGTNPPVGRRPGKTQTREAILESADRSFAAAGYSGASMRAIARDAGVDPALIAHFFGSKAGLFIAAVRWPVEPDEALAETLAGGREEVGRRLAGVFLRHWSGLETRSPIIALINAATVDPAAAALLRDFLMKKLMLPVLEALDADQRILRAGLVSAHLTGLGISRYVIGLLDPNEVSDEELVSAVAPTLQRYLTEPL
jgi:AcrR family transcriptional regulator